MKLTFLGVGDAFGAELGHNSVFLEFEETNLFIDFPATNRKFLRKLGKDLDVVENVFITHLHEDHINGIQQLAYYHQIMTKRKPNLYIYQGLLDDFWDTVKAGLGKTTKGRRFLDDYFNIHPIDNGKFQIGNQIFEIARTNHVLGMDSFGLLAEPFFYFSGDSNVDEPILKFVSNKVQKIFHDCHLWDLQIDSHASLNNIKELPHYVKEKIVLMHYHDGYADEPIRLNFEKRENIQLAQKCKTYNFGG